MCSGSGVGLTMSCKSYGGFVIPLPAGMCTGWTRRRGLTGMLLFCGGGRTNVRMGGGVVYDIRCFRWAAQIGSKWYVSCSSFFFFTEMVRQIYLGRQGSIQSVVGFRWLKVVCELFFLLLFHRDGEANISGSTGLNSVSGGFLSSGEEGVSSIHLDSVSKQMPASKYGCGGLVRFSVWYSGVTEGDGSGGVFKVNLVEGGMDQIL